MSPAGTGAGTFRCWAGMCDLQQRTKSRQSGHRRVFFLGGGGRRWGWGERRRGEGEEGRENRRDTNTKSLK